MTAVRGQRALITGAGHGLGRALAQRLAERGAEVIVTDLDAKRVSDTVRELQQAGATAFGYSLDVTSAEAVFALRDRLHAERGPVDILVNNAGVVFGGEFLKVPLERHRATLAVNVAGVFTVTHAFLPDLIAQPAGHVVNIVSASAFIALPWGVSYAASKWAALGFSESLREELHVLGHRHVRVTAVCPNFIATGMFAGARPARLTWFLRTEDVAAAVVRAVERDRELVALPWTVRFLYAVSGVLPRAGFRLMCRWLGVSTTMLDWRGHAQT